jgi:hypothetical protein
MPAQEPATQWTDHGVLRTCERTGACAPDGHGNTTKSVIREATRNCVGGYREEEASGRFPAEFRKRGRSPRQMGRSPAGARTAHADAPLPESATGSLRDPGSRPAQMRRRTRHRRPPENRGPPERCASSSRRNRRRPPPAARRCTHLEPPATQHRSPGARGSRRQPAGDIEPDAA